MCQVPGSSAINSTFCCAQGSISSIKVATWLTVSASIACSFIQDIDLVNALKNSKYRCSSPGTVIMKVLFFLSKVTITCLFALSVFWLRGDVKKQQGCLGVNYNPNTEVLNQHGRFLDMPPYNPAFIFRKKIKHDCTSVNILDCSSLQKYDFVLNTV